MPPTSGGPDPPVTEAKRGGVPAVELVSQLATSATGGQRPRLAAPCMMLVARREMLVARREMLVAESQRSR